MSSPPGKTPAAVSTRRSWYGQCLSVSGLLVVIRCLKPVWTPDFISPLLHSFSFDSRLFPASAPHHPIIHPSLRLSSLHSARRNPSALDSVSFPQTTSHDSLMAQHWRKHAAGEWQSTHKSFSILLFPFKRASALFGAPSDEIANTTKRIWRFVKKGTATVIVTDMMLLTQGHMRMGFVKRHNGGKKNTPVSVWIYYYTELAFIANHSIQFKHAQIVMLNAGKQSTQPQLPQWKICSLLFPFMSVVCKNARSPIWLIFFFYEAFCRFCFALFFVSFV